MARLSHGPAAPLYLALGSGKTGMTYTILQGSSLLEVRKSYFPHLHRWLTTPGQELSPPGELGHLHPYTESRDCLSCHATALPAKGLLVQPRFYNVGCESCHGPGKAHVKAMQAKNYTDVQMADLGALDATHLNDLCGKCHRTAAAVGNNVVQQEQTNRFQPYGLMLSRCFRESGNRLSCLTCHDPHSNASTNMKTYEAACLSCHVPEDGSSSAQGRGSAHATPRGQAHPGASHPMGKPCPLSPHTGCISCHMPARPVMAGIPITMNDHDIRVFVSGAGL